MTVIFYQTGWNFSLESSQFLRCHHNSGVETYRDLLYLEAAGATPNILHFDYLSAEIKL